MVDKLWTKLSTTSMYEQFATRKHNKDNCKKVDINKEELVFYFYKVYLNF